MNSSSFISRALQVSQVILIAILWVAIPLSATPNDEAEQTAQSYAFEFLTFKADTNQQAFLEVFCQIPTQSLQFAKTKDAFSAGYEVAINFFDDRNARVAGLHYSDSVKVATYNEIFVPREPQLVRFTFLLNPGDYLAKVQITDRETHAAIRFEKKIVMPDYFNNGLSLSSLQIASSISQVEHESALVKNNLKIIPNVARVFGMACNTIYVYSEIYNLRFNGPGSGAFNATVSIFNQGGNAVTTVAHTYSKPSDQCVLSFGLPIDKLQSGSYRLMVTIADLNSSEKTTQSANFIIVKPYVTEAGDEFASMLRQLQYLAPQTDLERLRKLSEQEKQRGLQEFLKRFDTTPETEQNEFIMEYYRRVYYSNQNFYNPKGEGWETPQGEIFIKNGAPNTIERQLNSDNKSYEVWEYYQLNRKFVFVDEWGLGQFRLLKTLEAVGDEFSLQ
ncbi:MAG TPA: GWxTD domain-containing protein [bacterium]